MIPSKRGLSRYRWVAATSWSNGVWGCASVSMMAIGLTLLFSAGFAVHGPGSGPLLIRPYGADFTRDGVMTATITAKRKRQPSVTGGPLNPLLAVWLALRQTDACPQVLWGAGNAVHGRKGTARRGPRQIGGIHRRGRVLDASRDAAGAHTAEPGGHGSVRAAVGCRRGCNGQRPDEDCGHAAGDQNFAPCRHLRPRVTHVAHDTASTRRTGFRRQDLGTQVADQTQTNERHRHHRPSQRYQRRDHEDTYRDERSHPQQPAHALCDVLMRGPVDRFPAQ